MYHRHEEGRTQQSGSRILPDTGRIVSPRSPARKRRFGRQDRPDRSAPWDRDIERLREDGNALLFYEERPFFLSNSLFGVISEAVLGFGLEPSLKRGATGAPVSGFL